MQGRGCLFCKAQYRLIHQVLHAALVQAVEQSQFQNAGAVAIIQTQMVFQNDAILCQGAGLVGTQHVHGTKVLDRVQTFDHHLVLGHGHRALGQVGGHNHGQHFRGQTDGNGQCEQEGFGPVAFGETVDQQHDGHHDQHEANQQPADAVNAPVKRSFGARADNGFGQRAEIGLGTGGHNHCRGRTADYVGAHKAHIVLFQHTGLGTGSRGTLAADGAKDIVLFNRQGFTCQGGLADEQVAGLYQAQVCRDHVPSRQAHNIAGHDLAHGDFAHDRSAGHGRASLYAGGGTNHGFQSLGSFAGTVLLPETQQAAQGDHDHNNQHAGVVHVFARAHGQDDVGDSADGGQHHQDRNKGIFKGQRQLNQGVGGLVPGDLVRAVFGQAAQGFGVGQAIQIGLYRGQGRLQAKPGFGGRAQLGVVVH